MDITKLTALELAQKIKRRELSCVEVTRAFLEKEDIYNAFITRDKEYALKRAEEVQLRIDSGEMCSALAGVPIAVKDNICTRDFRATCGSKMLESFIPPYNATVVEKINAADMIIIGKTNMDEFAMGSTGETSFFGAALNPLDTSRCAGGSSSGSAAAVAGGLAPLALGTDTGGSVRQPAAYCGITGLKPTYGAVSRYGLIAYASSLDTIGILSKNTADAAALFEIIKGADYRDSTSFYKPCERAKKPYRVKKLDKLPLSDYAVPAYYIIACAEASSNLARYDGVRFGHRAEDTKSVEELFVKSRTRGFGSEVKKRIMLGNFVLSAGYYDEYYLKALKVKRLITEEIMKALKDCDFLLLPTVTGAAPKLNESLMNPLEMYKTDTFTVIANLTGLPALTLSDGSQLIGKPFSETDLLSYEI